MEKRHHIVQQIIPNFMGCHNITQRVDRKTTNHLRESSGWDHTGSYIDLGSIWKMNSLSRYSGFKSNLTAEALAAFLFGNKIFMRN